MRFRRRPEQFEFGLRQATQGTTTEGHLAPMFKTVSMLSTLAEPVPPPPHRLAPGRQRLLSEAARLQEMRGQGARRRRPANGRRLQLATVVVAALLMFGVVFGVGSASAASLPGSPLYGLKLAVEDVQAQLVSSPEARADLAVSRAERRLLEIAELVDRGSTVDQPTIARAEHQLQLAVSAANLLDSEDSDEALERLQVAIRVHRRTMMSGLSQSPEMDAGPVRDFVRVMERMRRELNLGVGVPAGAQERTQAGTPPESEEIPAQGEGPGPGPGASGDTSPGPGASGDTAPSGPNYGTQPADGPGASDAPNGPWEPNPPRLGNGTNAGEPGAAVGSGSAGPGQAPACQGGDDCANPEPSPDPTPTPQGPGLQLRPGTNSSSADKGS